MAQIPLELVEAARNGTPGSLEPLIEAIWPIAYRLSLAIAGDPQGAEDAAQESCITVCRIVGTLRKADAFRAWLYRIVVRQVSCLKRQKPWSELVSESLPYYVDEATSIDVAQALSRLSKNLRQVVVLRYFEDLSSQEIGAILGVPAATVRFRLMTAKRRLRPMLDDTLNRDTPVEDEVRIHAI
jgi:RNA polymerase sigma factor (sigma-70 family)